MCDCFHLAFPNWHAASSGTGAGRRLRAPEPNTEDDSICDEPSQFTEGERPRPQGSSPVDEFPETGKYTDSDKECEAEHDPRHKSGSGKKSKKSGLGSMFEKRSTPKMSKLKEVHSPESGVIVKTAKDGCAEGLVYGGGGKEGIFIKEVVPESPASKSLKLKEGDQILSATVYFDNVSYEDAIQILEHAQAYKVKLCLKRKPDITETEPAIESDVIPEDDLYAPELREKGKTKRRGDARISWPKFPSFGKGRKSRFTRSHSSSEADEQRKLELSPTTSDTESPIKSQDAVKDKKKHKLKLSVLTKRGRISSSEDQDTDTPTTGQISGKILQTHDTSDMLSPEFLESPSGETPGVYVKEDQKVEEDLRLQQSDQKLTEPQTVQHRVELITIDNTLKTEDLTVALADKESSSGIKSPDGKKKKKERSELKMKILGKDKHKKDAKAKSPKRLKTLGASLEIPDQPDNEKSDVIPSSESHTKLQGDQQGLDANSQIISDEGSKVISAKSVTTQMKISVPKVELDISDVALIRKSPQKGEEKMTKGKDIKQKEETISATFKLPKIGFGDITTEETVQKVNVKAEESTTKFEQLPTEGTEAKEDPYERLSKRSLSRTQLPKREEIEIPGMEDMSMRITAKGIKEPKTGFTGRYDEIKAETVPMSIDVDSVKEAVSKLPGFKLPKVDTSGVPIPEEIIVIDANAQRISVKTPTKVVDTKTKHEAHFTKYDITASPEISKTTVKLPKMTPADITSEELLIETQVDLKKTEKKHKSKAKPSDKDIKTEDYKREDIIIPGKESVQEGAIHQAQDTVKIQGTAVIKSEYDSAVTLGPKESDKKAKKARITMPSFGISKQEIKIPDLGIDFPEQNISLQKGDTVKGERTIFLQDVKMESRKGKAETGESIFDAQTAEIDGIEYIDSVSGSDIKYVEAEDQTNKLPKSGAVTAEMNFNVPGVEKDINIDGAEIKTFEGEGKGSKFKMPNLAISMPRVKGPKIDLSLSKKDADVTLPQAKAEVKLQEVPEVDVTIGHVDVSIQEQRFDVEKPEVEIKPLMTEGERDGQGGKFRMPKFGISMPKVKGPEIDFSLSKKDVDMSLPEAKAEVKFPDVEEVDIKAPNVDIEGPSVDVKTTAAELDGKGSKFKMPKFGISLPKVKGPEIDLSLSKKDVDVTLPKAKAEVKLPDIEGTEPGVKVEVRAPEIAIHQQDVEESPSRFKMPTFKLPKFGVTAPNVSVEVCDVDKDVKFDGADINISEGEPACDIEAPSIDLQNEVELDGQGGKFKMPKLGVSMPKVKGPEIHFGMSKKDGDVTLPDAKAEVKVPEVEFKEPSAKVEIKAPEIKVAAKGTDGSPSKFKMPTFKLPKFGVGTPNISVNLPDMDKEVKTGAADINIPEEECVLNIAAPNIDTSIDVKTTGTEQDGKGSKFKMPHLGFSMPKVKGPKIDVSLSKKDIDVTLPEAKGDVNLPKVDLGKVDVSIPDAKIEVPESKAEIQLPEAPKIAVEMKPLESEAEMDGHGGRFKLPKFGVKMPKVKGPEFDLSLSKKDVDVKLPETKADVNLPDAPKIDVSLGKAEVLIPEAEIKKPEVQIKPLQTDTELDGHEGKFKMPKFGITMPKGPEINLGFSKKDVDVTLPEAKTEVILPDAPKMSMHMTPPECEAETDRQGSKFKMPKFGISMPKVKGPEIDLSFSKKDVDVTLPEAKAEVELPEAPKIAMDMKPPVCETEIDGQGSKFKMPQFGITMPKVKGPEIDLSFSKKDVEVTLPEAKAEVEIPDAPKIAMDIKPPVCETEIDGQGKKFKMPKFGMSMPKVKGPEIDLSFSKKDVEVTLPEAKAEVEIPDAPEIAMGIKPPVCETEIDGQGKKFKMPKFGMSMPKVKGPEIDFSFSKKDVEVTLPEAKAEVEIPDAPEIAMDIKPPVCETEIDGQGSKFKMPKFGMSMPKVKGPEIDLSFSKKDMDVTLPEAKAEVKLPDVEPKGPSVKVEINAPETEAQLGLKGSPSKFKMPTFKFPKFGVATPNVSVEVPDVDKEIKIDGADMQISVPHTDIDVPEVKAQVHLPEFEVKEPSGGVVVDLQPEVEVDTKVKKPKFSLPRFSFSKPSIKSPEIDVSLPDVDAAIPEGKVEVKGGEVNVNLPECEAEIDGQGRKFKMPKFGITMPTITGPDIDLSLSKKDVDVTLPEVKAEVKLPDAELKEPSAEVEIKAPDIKVRTKDTDGSPSKFKMPTFKLPKLGIGSPTATMEVPDVDKSVSVEVSDVDRGIKIDGADMQISVPHTDIDVPEVKAKVHLPEFEVKEPSGGVVVDLQPDVEVDTKVKKPKFSMPRFSFSKPSIKSPEVDVSLPDVDAAIPEGKVEVKGGEVNVNLPECEAEIDGQGRKFKMPKFGITMPKITGPDIDLSLSKKDVDVTLPEVKAEVKLPDAELKEPSAEVEIKAPDIKVRTKDTDGSPSKFKMPTFKLPKFGIGSPSATMEVPDVDKDVKIDGADMKIPEEVLTVEIAAPSIDTKGPSIDIKTTGTEYEGKGSKFKMPSLGFSVPQVKGPDIDLSLSKKDVDVTLPEARAEVQLPDVKIKQSPAKVEIKASEIETQTGTLEGSPSKFKMPTFKLPKFGAATPQVSVEGPDVNIKVDGADLELPKTKAEVELPDVEIKEPVAEISVQPAPVTEGDAKLKKPRFSLPKFSFSKQSIKEPGVDVSLPDVDVSLPEGKVEVKQPEVELKSPEVDVELDGQGSKFKMPKFGISMPKIKGPEIDLSLSKKDVDVTLPEAKAEVQLPDVKIKQPSTKVEIKGPEIKTQAGTLEGSPSKLKMPTFTLPKFGTTTPKVSVEGPAVDINIDGAKVEVPKEGAKVDIKAPSTDTEGLSVDVKAKGSELQGSGSKFKMPKFGISMPKVKGPEIDLSLSKKDVDVELPEVKAEVQIPDVELKHPSAEVEMKSPDIKVEMKDTDGSPSKFKMPTFKLPKFGISSPSAIVEVPDMDKDVKIDGADMKIPEEVLTVEIAAPSIDTKGPSIDIKTTGTEYEGKGSKFKMPSLGFSVPQVKGPDIDLSLSKKDVDVTLPEARAEVQLPDVKIKQSPAKVEIKSPGIDVQDSNIEGSPSKFKMPTFKLPKFGAATPQVSVEGPDVDIKVDGADLELPKTKAEVKLPDVEIKEPVAEISVQPAPVTEGDAKLKKPRFSLPKFSFSKQSIKEPGVDVSLPDVDVSLPEGKVEVKQPEVELKSPEVDVELDGQGSKFKMPKFGISMPKVKGPEIDLSLSKKDVDVTLPEAKAEVQLPDVKIKQPSTKVEIKGPEIKAQAGTLEGSPSKLKMPTFTLPKFGTTTPKVSGEVPDVDINIDGAKVEVPKEGAKVDIKAPSVDTEGLSVDVKAKGSELQGSGSKFKMPKFGITMPKITGPDIDLSLSKKDVDVTLPEVKAEVKLPDVELKEPSTEVEINAPDIKVATKDKDGSPSKFKMPTFKLPKFGIGSPSAIVEVPDMDKDVKIDGADMKIPEEVLTVEIAAPSIDTKGPSIDIKTTGTEYEGKGSKFKMPSLGFSVPQVKGPDIDLSLSKKDVDVTLPEARAEVQLPNVKIKQSPAKVEIKSPGIDVQDSNIEGSPSKFKMPTFKLPKFGAATPQVSVEGPDVDIKVDGADLELPKTKAEVKLPDVEIKEPVAEISVQPAPVTEGDAKLKKPRFSLPKFSFSKQSIKEPGVDVSLPDVDVSLPEGKVEVKQPEVELKSPEVDVELDGQGSKFKMPKFGISMPKVKGPEIDLSLSKKDVDVTLPEAKAEVQLPDVKLKSSAKVEIKGPEIKTQAGTLEGSPSKLKMPTFTLPKFGAATPKVSGEVPDKDINIDGAKVDITAPSVDTDGLSVDLKTKGSELEGTGSKFKMPNLAISMPKVKGPEIDLSLSKKDVDITLPEAKAEVQLPDVQVKEPEGTISVPDAPAVEVEAKLKRPNWTFPKFSFSKTGGKAPDIDVNLETPKVDVTSPEVKAEVCLPDVEVQGPSGAISIEEPPAGELDANLKKAKFSLPRFSFSKSSMKEPEVSADLPRVDVSLPVGEVIVKQPEIEVKTLKLEAEHDGQENKFKLPKFGITLPKVKGAEGNLSPSQKDVAITLPEVKAEVKLPEIEVKSSADVEIKTSETEAKLKDIGGSPLKFKMPTMKLPKFGGATYDVTVEAPDADKLVETDRIKLKEDVNVINIKSPVVDIKTDVSKAAITDADTPKTETEGLGSPSKFKLPSFKMPRLSFSKTKPEGDYVPVETECKEDEPEMEAELKGESKSQKTGLTSFGEILKTIDVEFDVPKTDENLETSKDGKETDEPSGKQLEPKEKETNTKQDMTKSPERTGWFKFPKFGLSSPSEPAKSSEKDDHKDEKSPVRETVDEELSPTCSVQSSDAFADISSAMTSEHVGLSLSSPTKVTVKYSDPDTALGLGEMHSNIITSTTRTELISVEPNLPEKITILSSGVSSSSEDTLRLESGKIHVFTSNIQATPEAQHAKLLTAIQFQSAEGPLLKSEANEASSWTVEESHSGKRTLFERHSVRETSSEISESKETIVITKQITRMFDSSEPISGETASSIQRLRDSVHSDKMKFFDGAEK